MTLKEATTNSLLMFVAATCVVLIVKAVSPAPQTVSAMAGTNTGSGSAAQQSVSAPAPAMRNGVKVYYLHGNTRCPTCRSIEAYAQEAVQNGFAEEMKNGKVTWEVINYETPGNEHYATDYEVIAPNVVLAKFEGGKQVAWKGLPEVWEHVSDKTTFVSFVQNSLRQFLGDPVTSSSPNPRPLPSVNESPQDPLPIPES